MARAAQDAERLNTPGRRRRSTIPTIKVDRDAFGKFAEAFARFMGTARFLFGMTVVVVVWILWNVPVGPPRPRFDPYPFIFLTLVLSLQASYAAPLILLAQNRQEARDRVISSGTASRRRRAEPTWTSWRARSPACGCRSVSWLRGTICDQNSGLSCAPSSPNSRAKTSPEFRALHPGSSRSHGIPARSSASIPRSVGCFAYRPSPRPSHKTHLGWVRARLSVQPFSVRPDLGNLDG